MQQKGKQTIDGKVNAFHLRSSFRGRALLLLFRFQRGIILIQKTTVSEGAIKRSIRIGTLKITLSINSAFTRRTRGHIDINNQSNSSRSFTTNETTAQSHNEAHPQSRGRYQRIFLLLSRKTANKGSKDGRVSMKQGKNSSDA